MRRLIFILLAMIGVSQAQTIQYIGAPTTTVISRGNFRTDSIFYLPKRSKAPTDTAALRYQISDSSLYAWTGSQWRKVGADADTLIYSTRAWRQKGDDSLAARINLKVNISDTASMLTPYTRGSGTTNYIPKFTAGSTIGNSQIFDDGSKVGIGTTTPNEKLEVFGGNLRIAKSSGEVAFVLRTGSAEFYAVHNASLYGLYSNDYGSLFVRDKSTGDLNIYDKLRIFNNGRLGINTTTDAGYRLDVNGTLRTVNGATFATTSGEILMGTTTDAGDYRLQVNGGGLFGSGNTDNQIVLAFPQDFKMRYRQQVSSAYGFDLDSANGENMILTAFEGAYQQAFLMMGDGVNKNVFGFSTSADNGVTFDPRFVINSNGNVGINTNAPSSALHVVGDILNTGTIKTGNPAGGTAQTYKLGSAATVSPTSPNRTIQIEVNGTIYYLHAKTTND